eukprot:81228_1
MANNLSAIDTIIVLAYIGCIFCVGMYAWWYQRQQQTKQAESYFLASRDVLWLAVGATLFSSNIGAEHFVGLAGTSAKSGIAVGAYEWTAPLLLLIQGYLVAGVYISSNIVTTPEYLEYRFNRIVRVYNAFITLVIYIFVVISSTLYAGAVILNTILGWSLYVSSIALILATGIYVVLGGLRAVVYTENVQTIILICGGLILMGYSFKEVGGLHGIYAKKDLFPVDFRSDYMHLFRPANDSEWPWPGITVGIIVQSYYYWCGNHLLIQRVLSSKSALHARYGAVLATFLKILPVWMMCIPGICAVLLYPDEFSKGDASEYDRAYPMMVLRILPTGLKGLVVAAMLSALMSSLAAVYNSAATIITNDIYKLMFVNVKMSDAKLVLIGRISACVFVCISLLWLPMIQNGNNALFEYTQAVSAYIQNPLSVVYCLGTFWNRANVFGAYCCIIIGAVLGFTRFIINFGFPNYCNKTLFCSMHFLYFGILLVSICTTVMIIGSLITKKPPEDKVNGLTYWTMTGKKRRKTTNIINVDENTEALLAEDSHEDNIDMGYQPTQRVSAIGMAKLSHISNPTDDEIQYDENVDEIEQIDNIDDNDNHRCGICWDFVHLTDDVQNKRWNLIVNIAAVISMLCLLAMWIIFF